MGDSGLRLLSLRSGASTELNPACHRGGLGLAPLLTSRGIQPTSICYPAPRSCLPDVSGFLRSQGRDLLLWLLLLRVAK